MSTNRHLSYTYRNIGKKCLALARTRGEQAPFRFENEQTDDLNISMESEGRVKG